MVVDQEKCTGCGICVQDCPLDAIRLKKKKAFVNDRCTNCGACIRVCNDGALSLEYPVLSEGIQCDACPIECQIKEGYIGACHRYKNEQGEIVRITTHHRFKDVKDIVGEDLGEAIRRPLITGIGAGTTYPDCKPSPYIVNRKIDDVDVVTVVTEAPLSYSSITVKIDTDIPIGDEGAEVRVGKRTVGRIATEQYGSKMLSIGGANQLTGNNGLLVARTIVDIANKNPVKLRVEGGSRLQIQVGEPPIVDGRKAFKMRVGCGSATLGLFAPLLMDSADEVIILDSHITGLMSEHTAGRFVGATPSGITLKFRQSTPGRYFGDHGKGWGGTSIVNPLDVIADLDMKLARIGMNLLVIDTTGQKGTMFELRKDGNLHEIPLSGQAKSALKTISDSCEPSLVSAVYIGGAGGSARAGVTGYPIKLTRAVHDCKASLTIGGAPTYVLPGGGITFMVDVQKVKSGAFYWTPTPATICPIEYTMELKDYEKIGGHIEVMKPFDVREPNNIERYGFEEELE